MTNNEGLAKALREALDKVRPLLEQARQVMEAQADAPKDVPKEKVPSHAGSLRARMRQEVVAELQAIIREAGNPHHHILVLTDYEVANLREVFRAAGHAQLVQRSPLMVLNNGDWVGQIAHKLLPLATDHTPNATAAQLARQANEYSSPPRHSPL